MSDNNSLLLSLIDTQYIILECASNMLMRSLPSLFLSCRHTGIKINNTSYINIRHICHHVS